MPRQGNTSTIVSYVFCKVDMAEWSMELQIKANRFALYIIKGWGSNLVEEEHKNCQLKNIIITLSGLMFRSILLLLIHDGDKYCYELMLSRVIFKASSTSLKIIIFYI